MGKDGILPLRSFKQVQVKTFKKFKHSNLIFILYLLGSHLSVWFPSIPDPQRRGGLHGPHANLFQTW